MADDWFAQQGPPSAPAAPRGGGGGGGDDWFTQYAPPGGPTSAPGGSPGFDERTGQPRAPTGGAPASGNPTDRNYVRSQLANWYASQGLTPTGPGTGPTDIEYYVDKILETGGWTNQTGKGEQNIDYWTKRIPQDLAEARGGGGGGAGGGGDQLAQLANSPGFQFRLQQGAQALERGAAAKGTLLTGGTAKALARYGQDYASTEYGNRVNQLSALSRLGLDAAVQQNAGGQTYAGQAGTVLGQQARNTNDLITGAGNAASAGTVGSANAWANGLAGVSNAGMNAAQLYYLSRLGNPSAPSGNSQVGPYAGGYQFPQ